MPTVAIDVRDAHVSMPHGSGVYVRRLVQALRATPGELEYRLLAGRLPGPELLWEQAGVPLALRRLSADLVHAPNCFLPLRRPCPGVVTLHDLAFEAYPEDFGRRTGWKYRTFARRAARSAERVICVSRFTARDACRRYRLAEERVRVVPLAPALPVGEASPPPGPYLLAVGDLRPKKNLATLVRAWRALRGQGLEHRLVLAGKDFGEGQRLRSLAGAEPLELTGFVSDQRLDALLRGADALVQPSLYEGFALNVAEAMTRGRPVILARAGALPETGADAATYFEALDAQDLQRAIRDVLEDGARRDELVARGRQRAAELSWESTARQTEAVYRELL